LERLILEQMQPHIDEVISVEQARFRNNRGCKVQVLALPTLIAGIAFIDLSAEYDTVWKHSLLCKFSNVIKCRKLVTLLEKILANRRFQVYLGNKQRE